jgi:uncharacterized OB-fold protein
MTELQVCSHCHTTHYPKRDICPSCWRDTLQWKKVSGQGHVTSTTLLHNSTKPEWADKLPLHLGMIKLDIGPSILAFLQGPMDIGTPVTLTHKDGVFTANKDTT